MDLNNLSIAIVSGDNEFAAQLSKHFDSIGWRPRTVGEDDVRSVLEDADLDVLLLDEPGDEVWTTCVQIREAGGTGSPALGVIVAEEKSTQPFRDAGADIGVPKPSTVVDVQDMIVGALLRLHPDL